jgi:chlorite dismutase
MKKLLILIVAAALFLHFYPQPKLENWYLEHKTNAIKLFSEATDTKVRLKADKIYMDLKSEFDSFNSEEQQFLKEITADRNTVKAFYIKYCKSKLQTPHFHRDNQKKVCQTINNYSALL